MLKLAISDYWDANHWYCRLLDANRNQLAGHEVSLNPRDFEYEGFLDMPSFLHNHAVPHQRQQDEARLIAQVGAWIGRNVYGPTAGKILAAGPGKWGHANGRPLALQDVSLRR